jgi:predicted NBD/HSP70 family sugar kinase
VSQSAYLVFDMGGTKTRYALYANGKLNNVVKTTTDVSKSGFDRFLAKLVKHAEGYDLDGVLGGMPGQCSGPDGVLSLAPNLPAWLGTPVVKQLKQSFGPQVTLLNDVMLGGVGEAHFGAGRADGVMVYFTVSTGTNAVRLLDGFPDRSISRYEVGRMIMSSEAGPVDLEETVGGAALERRMGRPPHDLHDPELWQEHARRLAVGVYNVSLLWSPSVIVFGGSMMRDIDLKLVDRHLRSLPQALLTFPELKYATLGDEMGLHGAVAWLQNL